MTPSPRITNVVLQERQDLQHTQVMLILARLEDKLTTLCQRVQTAEVSRARDQARIATLERRQDTMKQDIANIRKQTVRFLIVMGLLVGATSAATDTVLGLLAR